MVRSGQGRMGGGGQIAGNPRVRAEPIAQGGGCVTEPVPAAQHRSDSGIPRFPTGSQLLPFAAQESRPTCSFWTKNGAFSASILRNLLSRCLGASSARRMSITLHLGIARQRQHRHQQSRRYLSIATCTDPGHRSSVTNRRLKGGRVQVVG